MPFTFTWSSRDTGYLMEVHNGGETLRIHEINVRDDSVRMRMPIFESYISGTFDETHIRGSFITESRGREVPFEAVWGDLPQFALTRDPMADVSGVWEVLFGPGTEEQDPARGLFKQQGHRVTGTFQTPTGDYRYLDGVMDGDSLKLSTFDGAHAYLFLSRITDSMMDGMYYSGNHFKQPFSGLRNAAYQLPDADTQTNLLKGQYLQFSFPDNHGEMRSLDDPGFQNKVVVVQLMGTWCPNCLDETRFLVDYLHRHQGEDLRVVALAFEYAKTEEKAFRAIDRLKQQVGVSYPVLLAQYGGANKDAAHGKLPMLDEVTAYPTTLILDRQGLVRRIHTGFDGPATGAAYDRFRMEFDSLIQQLLAE